MPRLTLIGLVFLARLAVADDSPPYAFELPIEGRGCGGFSFEWGSMYLFQYSGRQLFEASPTGRLLPRQDVQGWYVVDVAVIDNTPIYCSRDRVFRKVDGRIEVNPIKDAKTLISITADDDEVFLLEAAPKSTIIVLDRETARERRRLPFDGRIPADVVAGDGSLWVFDRGDRCIHRVDKQTGETSLRFQAGPGVNHGSNGLLFRDGQLYVHEGDFARLRRVEWREERPAVWSWSGAVRMTFVQESWNEHESAVSTVNFRVPIPPNRETQAVGDATWSQEPAEVVEDRFGHAIARFGPIRIPPGGEHVLQYTVDVETRAVQYDPPVVPLAALDDIDPEIRATYLASNRLYQMEDSTIQAAAREARTNGTGDEPADVRSLIENIASYVIGRITYQLDDSWKDAATVLAGETGSCSEYSFLFSALCRLNNVPTRLVGGIQIGDYLTPHETKGFHRWTEVWFPGIGWVPVDVTKIDGAEDSLDYEFLFGTPGYLIVLYQGDFDEDALGMTYSIWRNYSGGRRRRNNYVSIEPVPDSETSPIVRLRK